MADLLDELIAPPTAFRFSVSVGILPLPIDCSFQEVSGLAQTMETEAVREGGENRLVHQLRIGDSLRVGWWITEACVMKATRRMTPWQAVRIPAIASCRDGPFVRNVHEHPGEELQWVHRLGAGRWPLGLVGPVRRASTHRSGRARTRDSYPARPE